ncbi:type II methionyl aminopeptidase [Candidatus Woesearchaeota archaeon]|nr:type II methionyl aminopeptidase [Candidatus Woesearchaeota archaeon]
MYSDEELERFREAGRITAGAREYGKGLIRVGASLREVTDLIEEKIVGLGGDMAFPVQISFNHTAAHNCPGPNDGTLFSTGDVLKLDLGAHVDGYVADTAVTIDLGSHSKLVAASEEALKNAIRIIKPGVTLGAIGKVIQDSIVGYGYVPIKNLSGHGVGRFSVHTAPQIPNYDNGDDTCVEEGMVFAIEPFATDGQGMVVEGDSAEIFMIEDKKPVRSPITRLVLREIEKFNGLPFTTRWLTRKMPYFKVNFALKELTEKGILRLYPPLNDKAKGLVSQAEHTVLVTGGGCEVLTK